MKRKAPVPPKDGSEASRAQRKRVQNRISQKCHRERQAAHSRHLETVVDIIKSGDKEEDNASDRYKALLRQHMKVIEEKRELEEAIFRMRKKLLSISNSAAAAADDEAVDALVGSKNRTRRQSEPDPPSPSPQPNQIESSNENSSVDVEAQIQAECVPLRNITVEQPCVTADSQELQPLDHANSHNMPTPIRGSIHSPINWNLNSEQPDPIVGTVVGQPTPQDQSYGWSFGALELTFPPDYQFSIPTPSTTVTVTSPTIFVETILHACKRYRGLRTSESDNGTMISHDIAAYGWSRDLQDMNLVQISEIGVHMLAAFAGLEAYIYGVGAASVMESVMRWQLTPTLASRNAVPEPFRPTPLQYSTNDYPHLLDFINWPAIRDQLILQSRTINLDEIIREVVRNTVVEVPHRHMSVNVLSLFYNSISHPSNSMAWNSNLKTAITDTQWKYLEIPAPPEMDLVFTNGDSTPAESALVQEISRRMDTGSNASSPENQLNTIDTVSTPRGNTPAVLENLTGSWSTSAQRRNEIVTHFGLDKVTKWKLSKEFARKHPFLDCSSAVAAYDMVSAQSALEVEARA